MAGGISDYLELELLDHVLQLGAANYTVPTNLYVSLWTSDPADAGSGTEVTGAACARKLWNMWELHPTTTQRSARNNGTFDFAAASSNLGTITHWGIHDHASAGNLLWYGPFDAPKTVNSGWIFHVPDEAIVLSFASGYVSTDLARKLLGHVLKIATLTPPTHIWAALFNNNPADDASGTEKDGTNDPGYARKAADAWTVAAAATDDADNTNAVAFAVATNNWTGKATHVALFDALTSGNMLFYGEITTPEGGVTINDTDQANIVAEGFKCQVDQ